MSIFYVLATRAFYFVKKKDTKWLFSPSSRNWPICVLGSDKICPSICVCIKIDGNYLTPPWVIVKKGVFGTPFWVIWFKFFCGAFLPLLPPAHSLRKLFPYKIFLYFKTHLRSTCFQPHFKYILYRVIFNPPQNVKQLTIDIGRAD